MLEAIGVPFDLTGRSRGSAMGPSALRYAGFFEQLSALTEIRDLGDLEVENIPHDQPGLRNFEQCLACNRALKKKCSEVLSNGNVPIVLGGDHSIGIGSVSAALDRFGDELVVLWLDAHADMNTLETSPSGNIHGMSVAALLGLESAGSQWNQILAEIVPKPRLSGNHAAWIGLRDVDPGEAKHLQALDDPFIATMQDIDRFNIESVAKAFLEWMKDHRGNKLWISFDVDSLDPVFAPGTGTTVRGGLTYREGHFLAELLHEGHKNGVFDLVGMDVVEVNPLLDHFNETAKISVEWVASLFGKTILGGYERDRFAQYR
jgi:arginase